MDKNYKCRHYLSGVVAVNDDNSQYYYSLTNSRFSKIKANGKVPLAFDSKNNLAAFKGMSEDGITVEIWKEKIKSTIELESETSAVMSGCFLDDNSFVMLQLDEETTIERSYIISVTDDTFSNITGYKISEENTKDIFSRLLSLGTVIERPVSVQCYGKNIYIISHQIFSDMINVAVYKLDRSEKKLRYVAGYHPISSKGRISTHFQEKDKVLFIYSENQLITVKGDGFPRNRIFNEPGEMLFLNDDNNPGTFLFFIPDNKAPGQSEIRKIRF